MTVNILCGDVLDMLATLPDNHFDTVVTSPPYWGLRDYGVAGQIGLEPTLTGHLEVMVRVFAEVHRVLNPTGTCWVNYGDCYARSSQGPLKPKDLCMVPNRFAIALQEWGWWVRSEIIWAKTNPMPESVKDRPASSHEKVFLFTKTGRYFYDAGAVRIERKGDEDANGFRGGSYVGGNPGGRATTGNKRVSDRPHGSTLSGGLYGRHHLSGAIPEDQRRGEKARGSKLASPRHRDHICHTTLDQTGRGEGRNLRNYEPAPVQAWEIATRPLKEAHFATFPPELVERCLKAGCPAGGRVLDIFGGAGTTALVADRYQLDCTLIEINSEYIDIARQRIEQDQGPLLAEVTA